MIGLYVLQVYMYYRFIYRFICTIGLSIGLYVL